MCFAGPFPRLFSVKAALFTVLSLGPYPFWIQRFNGNYSCNEYFPYESGEQGHEPMEFKMAEKLPLTAAPRALIEAGYEAPTYRTIYNRALDGVIPAKVGDNGRWTFDPSDLPAIADAMGLTDAHAA